MVPEFAVKYVLTLPPLARAFVCLGVLMLVAVFSVPFIGSQGIGSYYTVLGAAIILSITLLFVSPKTEITIKPETVSKKEVETSVQTRQHRPPEVRSTPILQKAGREKALHELTHGEKEFLAPYIFQDVTSQNVDVMGGIYQSLYKKQILDPPPPVGYLTRRDVLIQDWAKEYLKQHTELLKGYDKTPPQDVPWWWH